MNTANQNKSMLLLNNYKLALFNFLIKKDIRLASDQLILGDFLDVLIVKLIPFIITEIKALGDVVAPPAGSKVVYYSI